ncbi:P-loop containing nucleoside triphosphate hydrolase protein [Cantharellus anzutake]|uniref:P-loop containing nucleoside triphosphate hydrolase protein n=1 Tax=Cantharellus anzutake TaxID=1750568 RepID=UPI001904D9C6|nr:P-loop containing nucleoside triphosphate hydrolase protein [Cantharellus anzutake]KAF8339199.1 P-loop containing nucleoside triphosphate hydrolase protein [Cantharellus anzutake]
MSASITVAVRVRPPNPWESERLQSGYDKESFFMGDGHLTTSPAKTALTSRSLRPIVQVMDDKVLIFDPKDPDVRRSFETRGFAPPGTKRYKDQRYTFDRVFDMDARQTDVFENTTKPLLDGLLDGFNATVFAYGATGCGKTHTITGTESDPGIIYLTMAELFQRIEDKRDEVICDVSLSFLEIYNEEIRDLLVDGDAYIPRGGLAMRDDQSNRVTVPGLIEMRPKTADEVKEMVMQGNARRTQSPTHANQTSSRSHAVLQVNVAQTPRTAGTTEEKTMATLSIIDLAGSERASATTNMGQRMIEGANINKSLLALGNCINALCESGNRTRHVPYRNSKLTRLLKFSLGGNCRTVMIVCVAPASNHYEDTQNTLKYANRAKDIKTKISRNYINVDRHVGQYVEAINRLNAEVSELKQKLAGKLDTETEIQRRKRREAQAEISRLRADLSAKSEQSRRSLVDGAACEAQLFVANVRLKPIHARLAAIDKMDPSLQTSDVLAERSLLQLLSSPDEQAVEADSSLQRQIMKSGNCASLFEATLRAVSERKSDRLDESGVDAVRIEAQLQRTEMERSKAEARESISKAAVESQANFVTELVGLLARCTVMMADGSVTLQSAREVAAAMSRVAASNDSAFTALIGQSTAAFHSSKSSALLSFTSHPTPSILVRKPRSSIGMGGHAMSPRRLPTKSPRRPLRQSLSRAEPKREVIKKSVRWRDETSQGEIDDKGLKPAKKNSPIRPPIAPLVLQPGMNGKKKAGSESDGEWEDERTEDGVPAPQPPAAKRSSVPSKTRTGRLEPKFLKPSRPSPMSSVRASPLSNIVNSPPRLTSYAALGASPHELRPGINKAPASVTKSRRRSNLGSARVERLSRRRSSLIPRPSPPSAAYAYNQPRKSPAKKVRRSSMAVHSDSLLSFTFPTGKAGRSLFSNSLSSFTNDISATGKKVWR